MRLILDESVNMKVYRGLTALFGAHTWLRCGVDIAKGLNDVDLFFHIQAWLGCEVFVTSDLRQLDPDRQHERRACRDVGLHWIGIQKVPAKGRRAMTADASAFIGAFLYVCDHMATTTEPHLYVIPHGPAALNTAAVDVQPL